VFVEKDDGNTGQPNDLRVVFLNQPAFPEKMHAGNGFCQTNGIDQPPVYALGISVKLTSELLPQKVFLSQDNSLINEKEKGNKDYKVNQRIDENTDSEKHQNITHI